jgi:hypothetical protein
MYGKKFALKLARESVQRVLHPRVPVKSPAIPMIIQSAGAPVNFSGFFWFLNPLISELLKKVLGGLHFFSKAVYYKKTLRGLLFYNNQ